MRTLLRQLPWLAGAGALAAMAIWLHRDARIPREAFQDYSVHNTGPEGLSLARRYLDAQGTSVGLLTRPMERAVLEPDAVLFRIGPSTCVPPGLQPAKDDG